VLIDDDPHFPGVPLCAPAGRAVQTAGMPANLVPPRAFLTPPVLPVPSWPWDLCLAGTASLACSEPPRGARARWWRPGRTRKSGPLVSYPGHAPVRGDTGAVVCVAHAGCRPALRL